MKIPQLPATTEQRRLFNPAVMAVALRAAAKGYGERNSAALQIPLALVIIPLAFHPASRTALPGSTVRSMRGWVRENPQAVFDLEERRRELLSFTLEGIRFGLATGVLIGHDLRIEAGKYRMPRSHVDVDVKTLVKASEKLGKWFGVQKYSVSELLAIWGVGI